MENEAPEFCDIALERRHLDRLARRITYLELKIKEMAITKKDNRFEIQEYEAIKWAYQIALPLHRTHLRMLVWFAAKFPDKEKK